MQGNKYNLLIPRVGKSQKVNMGNLPSDENKKDGCHINISPSPSSVLYAPHIFAGHRQRAATQAPQCQRGDNPLTERLDQSLTHREPSEWILAREQDLSALSGNSSGRNSGQRLVPSSRWHADYNGSMPHGVMSGCPHDMDSSDDEIVARGGGGQSSVIRSRRSKSVFKSSDDNHGQGGKVKTSNFQVRAAFSNGNSVDLEALGGGSHVKKEALEKHQATFESNRGHRHASHQKQTDVELLERNLSSVEDRNAQHTKIISNKSDLDAVRQNPSNMAHRYAHQTSSQPQNEEATKLGWNMLNDLKVISSVKSWTKKERKPETGRSSSELQRRGFSDAHSPAQKSKSQDTYFSGPAPPVQRSQSVNQQSNRHQLQPQFSLDPPPKHDSLLAAHSSFESGGFSIQGQSGHFSMEGQSGQFSTQPMVYGIPEINETMEDVLNGECQRVSSKANHSNNNECEQMHIKGDLKRAPVFTTAPGSTDINFEMFNNFYGNVPCKPQVIRNSDYASSQDGRREASQTMNVNLASSRSEADLQLSREFSGNISDQNLVSIQPSEKLFGSLAPSLHSTYDSHVPTSPLSQTFPNTDTGQFDPHMESPEASHLSASFMDSHPHSSSNSSANTSDFLALAKGKNPNRKITSFFKEDTGNGNCIFNPQNAGNVQMNVSEHSPQKNTVPLIHDAVKSDFIGQSKRTTATTETTRFDPMPDTATTEITRFDPMPHTATTETTRFDPMPHTATTETTRFDPMPHTATTKTTRFDPMPHTATTKTTRFDPMPHTATTETTRFDPMPDTATTETTRFDSMPDTATTETTRFDPMPDTATTETTRFDPMPDTATTETTRFDPMPDTATTETARFDPMPDAATTETARFDPMPDTATTETTRFDPMLGTAAIRRLEGAWARANQDSSRLSHTKVRMRRDTPVTSPQPSDQMTSLVPSSTAKLAVKFAENEDLPKTPCLPYGPKMNTSKCDGISDNDSDTNSNAKTIANNMNNNNNNNNSSSSNDYVADQDRQRYIPHADDVRQLGPRCTPSSPRFDDIYEDSSSNNNNNSNNKNDNYEDQIVTDRENQFHNFPGPHGLDHLGQRQMPIPPQPRPIIANDLPPGGATAAAAAADNPRQHQPMVGMDEVGAAQATAFLTPDRDMLSVLDRPGNICFFAAYLLVSDEDIDSFGRPFHLILESWGLRVFFPLRDLLMSGYHYEAIAAIVEQRCNGKVIVVVSRNYPHSKECQFLTAFARTLDPDARLKNIVPVYIDKDIPNLPRTLNGLASIQYNQSYRRGWLKDRILWALRSQRH